MTFSHIGDVHWAEPLQPHWTAKFFITEVKIKAGGERTY